MGKGKVIGTVAAAVVIPAAGGCRCDIYTSAARYNIKQHAVLLRQ